MGLLNGNGTAAILPAVPWGSSLGLVRGGELRTDAGLGTNFLRRIAGAVDAGAGAAVGDGDQPDRDERRRNREDRARVVREPGRSLRVVHHRLPDARRADR